MTLMPGARLGPYEILGLIGAGGMGDVYRAKDTRLDRTVAIKVLPSDISGDPDRRARFQREAKTIAGLNHPHICTLYDVGDHGGSTFLVMEYLAGESLAERLRNGPLPVERALAVATEIADALSAAHRQGIIHRDLKPANVMLTKSGAKLLDFGLAKLRTACTVASVAAPTTMIAEPLTARGLVLGTIPYMSPEQLEGREADARSDLFALGGVLFEALAGRRAFEGGSEAGIIAAILSEQRPDVSALGTAVPPALRRLVQKCLAKDPDARWQAASDVADELRWIAAESRTADAPVDARGRARTIERPRRRWMAALPWAVASAAIGAALAAAMWPRPEIAPRVMRVALPLPADAPFGTTLFDGIAISHDGQTVAYSSEKGIYVRALSGDAFRAIPGTANSRSPQFSPDGAWLAYGNNQGIYKVPVAGGAPVRLVQSPTMATFVGDWRSDGSILFMPSATTGILSVPAEGGATRRVATPVAEKGEAFVGWPQQVGRSGPLIVTVLPESAESPDDCQVAIDNPAAPGQRVVLGNGTFGRYLATGHLMFGRGGQILVAPMDLAARRLTGPSEPVVARVVTNAIVGLVHAAVSDNGTLAYVPGAMQWVGPSRLVTIDRQGVEHPFGHPQSFVMLELDATADGGRVAVRAGKMNDDIHVLDAAAGTFNRVTFEGGNEVSPAWSPDGRRLAYYSSRYGAPGIYVRDVSAAGEPMLLVRDDQRQLPVPSSFSPDGRWLVFGRVGPMTGWDIWRVPSAGTGPPEALVRTRWDELNATVSPDGAWMAFQSTEGGNAQAYFCRFPGLADKRQVSVEGGTEPRWSTTRRELFFRDGDRLMVSALDGAATLRSGPPRVVLQRAFERALRPYGFNYAVLPGGQRFVFARNVAPEPAREIRLIVNWFEELKTKVPIK